MYHRLASSAPMSGAGPITLRSPSKSVAGRPGRSGTISSSSYLTSSCAWDLRVPRLLPNYNICCKKLQLVQLGGNPSVVVCSDSVTLVKRQSRRFRRLCLGDSAFREQARRAIPPPRPAGSESPLSIPACNKNTPGRSPPWPSRGSWPGPRTETRSCPPAPCPQCRR